MPHFTLDIERSGAMLDVGIGISESRRERMMLAGLPVPRLRMVRALIDTGASGTVVDASIPPLLGIEPTSTIRIHTSTTRGSPVEHPVFDLSIWLIHQQSQQVWDRSLPIAAADLRTQGLGLLLGRDVLAECLMIYDGPGRRFSLAF
jgi:hypothetical protein